MNIHFKKVTIRESTLNDANEVAAIHVKSCQQSYRNIIDDHYLKNISFSDKLERRNKILQSNDPNQIHLVAVYEKKLLAFAMLALLLRAPLIIVAKSMRFTCLKNLKK